MDELEEIETSIAQSSQNNATILDVFVGPNLKGSEFFFKNNPYQSLLFLQLSQFASVLFVFKMFRA